jgi:hypothetical protein
MRLRAHIFRRGYCFRRGWLSTLFLGVVLLGLPTCSRKIGDSCKSNVECSPLGDRFCDLSSPYGYCTVEGCDSKSCPDGAACISFFSLQRNGPRSQCTPGKVVRPNCKGPDCCDPTVHACCRVGERCLCDGEGCKEAYCASETTERRWCMQPCDEQSDCDPDYTCYATNQGGTVAIVAPTDDGSEAPLVQYCGPNGVTGK